jgi:hypothetical protein
LNFSKRGIEFLRQLSINKQEAQPNNKTLLGFSGSRRSNRKEIKQFQQMSKFVFILFYIVLRLLAGNGQLDFSTELSKLS